MPSRIENDLYVGGALVVAGTVSLPAGTLSGSHFRTDAEITRHQLKQDPLKVYSISLLAFRIWDALQTNLPGTPADDDLGLHTGTLGTDAPTIRTRDVKALGAVTHRARVVVALPMEYDDGETVQVRAKAGMLTTVADVSATIDLEVYRILRTGAVGGDLCVTAAQSINSLTLADKTFDLDESTLIAGDLLDIRVSIATNDAATATVVQGVLTALDLLCDVRG
jgi:hypothetical protein